MSNKRIYCAASKHINLLCLCFLDTITTPKLGDLTTFEVDYLFSYYISDPDSIFRNNVRICIDGSHVGVPPEYELHKVVLAAAMLLHESIATPVLVFYGSLANAVDRDDAKDLILKNTEKGSIVVLCPFDMERDKPQYWLSATDLSTDTGKTAYPDSPQWEQCDSWDVVGYAQGLNATTAQPNSLVSQLCSAGLVCLLPAKQSKFLKGQNECFEVWCLLQP